MGLWGMERLINNEFTHESWNEYAEHSLTHDDVPDFVVVAMQTADVNKASLSDH
jgi:hypothetical protein